MQLRSKYNAAFIALALLCGAPASAAVIDFDGTGAPDVFVDTAPLSSQYAGLGVTFAGATGIGGSILNQASEFGFGARSGTDFLAFNVDAGTGTDERISFASDQNMVSLYAATIDSAAFTLSAFDIGGNLLGSTSLNADGNWQELTLALAGIRSVVLSSTAFSFALDDLVFEGEAAQVPEPASVGLIAAGLLGFAAARRRRRG
jgi:hypothetical protein